MFGKSIILVSLLQGASVVLSVLAIYLFAFSTGRSQPDVRAMAFTALVIGNLSLIFVNRSQSRLVLATLRSPNAALWWITAGVLVALGLIWYVPFLQDIFDFTSPRPLELLLSVAVGLVSVLWFEVYNTLSGSR
jgi:Ca2+-transporting ATPase